MKIGRIRYYDENYTDSRHLATKEIGHVPPFWDNMKYLLEIAIEIDIYTKVDYAQRNVPYCGTKITDTPLD